MGFNYITTKFLIPVSPQRYVIRQRVVEALQYKEGVRLSVIAAPAGFGKTTAVIHWIQDMLNTGEPTSQKFAWLSLDESDDVFAQFVGYFIGAVQRVEKDFAHDLAVSIQSGQHPEVDFVATELINQFSSLDSRLHVILDDFHVISDKYILDLLNRTIEYLPPNIHFLLTSRKTVPLNLPRWRGKGWLHEIEAKDLRFTVEETQKFLEKTMQFSVDLNVAEALHKNTDGWAVGLYLLASSLQDESSISVLSPDNSHISDYLMAEVFAQQPQYIQEFLLRTSIVDTFNIELCIAIGGLEAEETRATLSKLEENALFFVVLDQESRWYQYHKLFYEFLEKQRQQTLDAAAIKDLYQKASNWYGENQNIVKAVDYALLAEDFAQAAYWIEKIAFKDIWSNTFGSKFAVWIPKIPHEKLIDYPQVILYAVGAFLVRSETTELTKILDLLYESVPITQEAKLFQGILLKIEGKYDEALKLFNEVLEAISQDNIFYLFTISQIGVTLNELGKLPQATEIMSAYNTEYVANHEIQPIPWLQFLTVLSSVYFLQGELSKAERTLQQGFDYLELTKYETSMVGLLHIGMGQITFEKNEAAQAEAHFRNALRWGQLSGVADILHGAHLGLANVFMMQNSPAALDHLLAAYQVFYEEYETLPYKDQVNARMAYANLHLRNYDEAFQWAAGISIDFGENPTHQQYMIMQIFVTVRIWQFAVEDEFSEAEALLALIEDILHQYKQENYLLYYLRCLIGKAILLDKLGRTSQAQQAFDEALEIFEISPLTRVFLAWKELLLDILTSALAASSHRESIQFLLSALAKEPGVKIEEDQDTSEFENPLTPRELEILTLISLGLTNKQICEKLVISENTLRTHIRNLYRKLDVKSRTQAVKAGQDLSLI